MFNRGLDRQVKILAFVALYHFDHFGVHTILPSDNLTNELYLQFNFTPLPQPQKYKQLLIGHTVLTLFMLELGGTSLHAPRTTSSNRPAASSSPPPGTLTIAVAAPKTLGIKLSWLHKIHCYRCHGIKYTKAFLF